MNDQQTPSYSAYIAARASEAEAEKRWLNDDSCEPSDEQHPACQAYRVAHDASQRALEKWTDAAMAGPAPRLVEQYDVDEWSIYGLWDVLGLSIGQVIGVPDCDRATARASGGLQGFVRSWAADRSDWDLFEDREVMDETRDAVGKIFRHHAEALFAAHRPEPRVNTHEAQLYWTTPESTPELGPAGVGNGWCLRYRDDDGVEHHVAIYGDQDITLGALALELAEDVDCADLTGIIKVVSSEEHPTCAGRITLRDGQLMGWE